jgi:hypothetical protein
MATIPKTRKSLEDFDDEEEDFDDEDFAGEDFDEDEDFYDEDELDLWSRFDEMYKTSRNGDRVL